LKQSCSFYNTVVLTVFIIIILLRFLLLKTEINCLCMCVCACVRACTQHHRGASAAHVSLECWHNPCYRWCCPRWRWAWFRPAAKQRGARGWASISQISTRTNSCKVTRTNTHALSWTC